MQKTIHIFRKFILLAAVLLFSINVFADAPKKVVKLRKTKQAVKIKMVVGDHLQLVVKDGKRIVNAKKIQFKTSKKSVAVINKKGLITAKRPGETVITGKYKSKFVKIKMYIAETPKDQNLYATAVYLYPYNVTLTVGKTKQLLTIVLPQNTTDELIWEIDNPNVATVSHAGLVTALNPGMATITAIAGSKSAKATIHVDEIFVDPNVPATAVYITSSDVTLTVGKTKQLFTILLPQNTTDEVIWETENPDVATISPSGLVTAVKKGVATITATAGSKSAKSTVFVENEKQTETHIKLHVNTAEELINAVNTARINEEEGVIFDISIASGTYELWNVLDKEELTGTGDQHYHRGLELPDRCNLYGIGTVVLKCTIPESENSSAHPYTRIVSTLNMHGTDNILSNIHFVGSNTRYCIHDDSGFGYSFKTLHINNCRFTHTGTESDLYMPDPRCYGAGFTTGRKAYFKNCVFESAGNCNRQLYIHTHADNYNVSDIETFVDNCAFITPNKTPIHYQIPWYTSYGGKLTINNSYFAEGSTVLLDSLVGSVVFGGGNSAFTFENKNNSTIYLVP